MGKEWTDEQIDDLLKQSRETFGTTLPLAAEIEKMDAFVRAMLYSAGKKDGFKFRITKVIFQWRHLGIGWSRTEEIEVPYDTAWDVFHAARGHLDRMCEELKDLLGNKYVASTKVKK